MDDLIIFNRSLDIKQILILNGSQKNLIDSSLTILRDNWSACVTSNDRFQDGIMLCSNNLTILSDTINPSVQTINTPAGRTNFTTNQIIVFNTSVSDEIGVTSVLFQISNGSNPGNVTGSSTNASLFNASLTATSVNIVDGNHTLIVFASDGAGNMNGTVNTTFVVDTTAPNVVVLLNASINGTGGTSNLSKNTPTFSFNATDGIGSLMNCTLFVDGVASIANINASNKSQTDQIAGGSLSEGLHTWSVTCSDSVRLSNVSITTNLTIDTVVPEVTITSPVDRTNFTTGGNVTFAIRVQNSSGSAIHAVLFEVTNVSSGFNRTGIALNTTVYNASIIVIATTDDPNITEGNHTVIVFANDTAGNVNRSMNVTFIVDTTAPKVVELYNLTERSNLTKNVPTFSFQVNDSLSPTMTCELVINNNVNITGIAAGNGTTVNQIATRSMPDGSYNWNVNCNDSVRISNISIMNNFTIDVNNPSVQTINTPAERTNFTTNQIIVFNASVSDGIGVTSVLFQISNGSNPGNVTSSSTNASLFNASLTATSVNVVDGNHTLIVFASDAVGNMNGTVNTTFVVDTTAPNTVQLYNLTENRSIIDTTPIFQWQVNDTWATTLTCDLIIDDNISTSNISSINGTTINYTIGTAIATGLHNWSVSCNDTVLLNNYSITQNFTINGTDITPPTLSGASATLISSTTAKLIVTTDEAATCKYGTTEDSYAAMANTMDGSGTTSHSYSVTGLSSSRTYVYYVRCQDTIGNTNPSSTLISFTTTGSDSGGGGSSSDSGSIIGGEVSDEVSGDETSSSALATTEEVKGLLTTGKVTVDVMTAAGITSESISSESISTTDKITFTIVNNGDKTVQLYPELKEELVVSESITEFEENLREWLSEIGETLTEEQIGFYKLVEQKGVQPIFTEKMFSLDNLFKTSEVPIGEQAISTKPIATMTAVPVSYINDGGKTIILKPELKGKDFVLENEAEMEDALKLRVGEERSDLTEEGKEKLVQKIMKSIKITGDVQPILIEKAFSLFESNQGIVHTGQQITGKLLESYLEDCGEVILNPGESFEKTCTVHRGITADSTPTKIIFKSEDKEILEKDVSPQEGAIGAAVDIDLQGNLIELYMLIPKVDEISEEFNDYSLEFMIEDKLADVTSGDTNLKYLFAELFGSFLVQENKGFVFAQQLKYNPTVYYGNKSIQTRVIKNGEVVAKHEFNAYLGEQEGQTDLAILEDRMSSIIFVFSLLSIIILWLGAIIITANSGNDLNGNRKTRSRFFKVIFFLVLILLSVYLLFSLSTEHSIKNDTPQLNQDTWLSSGITYTGQQISGKLLESYLENCGELVVKPGERFENTCTIRNGLSASSIGRKIVFKSLGEEVLEKDIAPEEAEMGVTVDLFKDEHLLELYMLIPAVDGPSEKHNNYFLEFTVNNELNSKPIYAEVYGPYLVREDKGFIFAQQLKYNPEMYAGKKIIQTKLLKENQIIAQQNYTADFGMNETGIIKNFGNNYFGDENLGWFVLITAFMFILIPTVIIRYIFKKRRDI